MKQSTFYVKLMLFTLLVIVLIRLPEIDFDKESKQDEASFFTSSAETSEDVADFRIVTRRHDGNMFFVLLNSAGEPIDFIRP